MRNQKIVVFLPILAIAVVGFILYIPEIYLLLFKTSKYIPILSDLQFIEKTNIILTVGIVYFAAMEGYSTFLQVILEGRRNRIEDARNELEKAYGPLYTLLNRVEETRENVVELNEGEKSYLDRILATYPFMFPSEIYNVWRQRIQTHEAGFYLGPGEDIRPVYSIPLEFRDMINEEYDRRVKLYNELLKK